VLLLEVQNLPPLLYSWTIASGLDEFWRRSVDKYRWNKGDKVGIIWNDWHHDWEKGESLQPLADSLYNHLQQLIGNAHPAEQGRSACSCENEECSCKQPVAHISLIEIQHSPIRWVDAAMDGNELLWGEIEYGIPDPRPFPDIKIRARGVKSFPIFGRINGLRWDFVSGDKVLATRIIRSLAGNSAITSGIIDTGSLDDDPIIWTSPEHGLWWIGMLWRNPYLAPLSAQQWACLEKIADHLLAMPIS